MTWIKSSLQRPDGRPLEGRRVSAMLMTRPGWRADRSGQVLGEVHTQTDVDGVWRMNLAPYTDFEESLAPFIYYQVEEQGLSKLSLISVPPVTNPHDELWMRDVLIDAPPQLADPWLPVTTIGRLSNVDHSADTAGDGTFLTMENGKWRPSVPAFSLVALSDVAITALDGVQPGDPLVYLGGGRFGFYRPPPETDEA